MKKLIAICTSLILLLAFSCCAFADGLYQIDAQTGQIVGAPLGDGDAVNLTRLTTTCAYNKESGMYVYSGEAGSVSEFSCSVYSGMYTTRNVSLQADPTEQLKVYCDGEEVEFAGEADFNICGSYIVRDKNNVQVHNFTILPWITGSITSYNVPSIFFIDSVTVNGEVRSADSNVISMSEDGEYTINYFCYDSGVSYALNVTIDHTPPELEIIGLNEEGYAQNAVSFGKTEPESTLTVMLDGEEIEYGEALTDAGDYEIAYTDEAGNVSQYGFTIRPYLDLNAWIVVVIASVLFIAVIAFMIYTRTHMKVR